MMKSHGATEAYETVHPWPWDVWLRQTSNHNCPKELTGQQEKDYNNTSPRDTPATEGQALVAKRIAQRTVRDNQVVEFPSRLLSDQMLFRPWDIWILQGYQHQKVERRSKEVRNSWPRMRPRANRQIIQNATGEESEAELPSNQQRPQVFKAEQLKYRPWETDSSSRKLPRGRDIQRNLRPRVRLRAYRGWTRGHALPEEQGEIYHNASRRPTWIVPWLSGCSIRSSRVQFVKTSIVNNSNRPSWDASPVRVETETGATVQYLSGDVCTYYPYIPFPANDNCVHTVVTLLMSRKSNRHPQRDLRLILRQSKGESLQAPGRPPKPRDLRGTHVGSTETNGTFPRVGSLKPSMQGRATALISERPHGYEIDSL